MTTLLWKAFFEDDVDSFHAVLANPSDSSTTATAKCKANERAASGSHGTSPGPRPSQIKGFESRNPSGGRSKPIQGWMLTRAGINLRNKSGLALLHLIASSTRESASVFATKLLEVPLLDLYTQDAENGWTALHRALYFGNITIARAILDRDTQDATMHNHLAGSRAGSLIKTKDNEGNSPFDLFATSIAPRSITKPLDIAEISPLSDGDDQEPAQGVSGDRDDEDFQGRAIQPTVNVNGDELFAFGSNQNLTLGFGDEDDRHFPERIVLKRPDRLVQRLVVDHEQRCDDGRTTRSHAATQNEDKGAPACVKLKPIAIQDAQMSKLHTAVLTADPEANLYVCGFGPGGRLGMGDEITRFHYVSVSGGALAGRRVIHVGLGQNHTIAITSLGETITWGNNTYGQLGYSTSSTQSDEESKQLLPKQVFGTLKKEYIIGAAASRLHSVVHASHSLYTFGKNEGQLGLVDSDARSLEVQTVPRKVGASLFSSAIASVTAIDHATICLLKTHEVWIFANYGYTKLSLNTETLASHFLRTSYSLTRYGNVTNHVIKVTAKRDTICALTSMGEVFTINIKAKPGPASKDTSTTNPAKIRNALSVPVRVWSNSKDHMRVQDVEVGQDGSIIICTAAGSVWTRIKRTKIKTQRNQSSFDTRPRDYKFSRVPGLTSIVAVRANAYGAYAAVRRDCDILKEEVVVGPPNLWRDLFPLLPLRGIDAQADAVSTNPPLHFWVGAPDVNDTAGYRRAVLTLPDLEAALISLFADTGPAHLAHYDVRVATSDSKVKIPVHQFILASRSTILRQALTLVREQYFYSIPEVLIIEYDEDGKILVQFLNADIITVYNMVLYLYTDTVADVWHHTRTSPRYATRYRQTRLELLRIASTLSMRSLESAVRLMNEPAKVLQADMETAVTDIALFDGADVIVKLNNRSMKAHSALLCQRCPFFEGLLAGRTGGGWLSSRKSSAVEPQDLTEVDLRHIRSDIFQYVMRYLYADTDATMFDNINVNSLDDFIDLVLEVLSVANELMLERLSEVCQKVLAQHVNTRNICQLLNAVAPCSVTSFKDAGLEYICLNMETMLESNLLCELDKDLILELDAVTRENQLAHQPVSRSGRAEAELLEQYPQLSEIFERSREDTLEDIEAQTARFDNEARHPAMAKARSIIPERSAIPLNVPRARRTSSQLQGMPSKSPKIRSKASSGDILLNDEDNKRSLATTDLADQADTLQPDSAPGSPEIAIPDSLGLSSPPAQTATPQQPWATPSFTSSKLEMKVIMAQANGSRASALSTALKDRPFLQKATKSSQAAKLSQKERKRQHSEAVRQETQTETPSPASPLSKPEIHCSPWQAASSRPKTSLKDIIGLEASTLDTFHALTSSPRLNGPSHTLRQTVPGNVRSVPKSTSSVPQSPELRRASHAASSTNIPSTPPRPTSSRSTSAQQPLHQFSPQVSTPSIQIQSIRHTPLPQPQSFDPDDLYSAAGFSISDIVSQQQMEKDAIKEAAAKRSLQEIQEEQAFQEWWDEESRKVQEEEYTSQRKNTGTSNGGGRSQRGKEARRGRERGRRSGDRQLDSGDPKAGERPRGAQVTIGSGDKAAASAGAHPHARRSSSATHHSRLNNRGRDAGV